MSVQDRIDSVLERKTRPNGRVCTFCRQFKPRRAFWVDKRSKSGIVSRCKSCQKLPSDLREEMSEFFKELDGIL